MYSWCGLASVVGFDKSAKFVGVVACCAVAVETVRAAASMVHIRAGTLVFIVRLLYLTLTTSSGFHVWSKNSTPVP